MTYLLAFDQGTSSSRSIVFNERGHIVAMAQQALPQIYPQPGWVEHDPQEIWRGQLATARQALAKAGLKASDMRALGITNQRETTGVWNMPIFRVASSNGCSTKYRGGALRPNVASWLLAPSTAG